MYLSGIPQRVGTAVDAEAGCSVLWSLSVTASKCMDFEGFPFQNRTLESERAI